MAIPIVITQEGFVAEIKQYLRLADKADNQMGGDFHAANVRFEKNTLAAHTILTLAEKEAGCNPGGSTSVLGLTRRLVKLIGEDELDG